MTGKAIRIFIFLRLLLRKISYHHLFDDQILYCKKIFKTFFEEEKIDQKILSDGSLFVLAFPHLKRGNVKSVPL